MLYKGLFRDINNNLYTVNITTNDDTSTTKEIILAETPFTTSIETGDDHLYKPCKYSSSTIKILSEDYLFDLYASTAQQNKVELIDSQNTIKWVGYLTPNLYSQGYENPIEELELEAIDALSTLQYYDYVPLDGTSKSVVKIIDIIDSLLQKCNAYSTYYINSATQLSKSNTESLIDKLYISEQNFFDEDDEAMKMQEVLEEICQYLNLTCVADGDMVYFIDYDAIKNGYNTYNKYTVGNTSSYSTVTLSQSKTIKVTDYVENGGQISLDNVSNKVTIKDSLYTFENLIPDIFDEDDLTNKTSNTDSSLSTSTSIKNGAYGEVVGTNGKYTIAFLDKVYNEQKNKYKSTCVVAVQYYDNPNYKFYDYTNTNKTTYNYTDTQSMRGAIIGKFFVEKLDKSDSDMTEDMEDILSGGTTLEKYLAANEISKFDYTDYLVLLNPSTNHISNSVITSYPYFETSVTNGSALFGGENAYILISGSMLMNSTKMGNETYPVPDDCIDPSEGRYHYYHGDMYLLAKLQWGNLFWNGTTWSTTNSTFKIPFSTDNYPRIDGSLLKDFEIKNTVTWKTGSDNKGYCIKCPSTYIMSGLPKLTVYKPMDFEVYHNGDSEGNYYPTSVMFLKDFKIEAFIGDPTFSDDNETDTEYTNVINEDFVNEMDEIEMKICTWDNKAPNYSCVAYLDSDNELKFLDEVYNKATNITKRLEEQMIYRLVNQYSTPSTILELNLKNDIKLYSTITDTFFSDKLFIVDGLSIDWEFNKAELRLIEKK